MSESGTLSFDWNGPLVAGSVDVSRETQKEAKVSLLPPKQNQQIIQTTATEKTLVSDVPLDAIAYAGSPFSISKNSAELPHDLEGSASDELSSLLAEIETVSTKPKSEGVAQKVGQAIASYEKSVKASQPNLPLMLKIKDQKTLQAVWMPLFKFGGLFLPTEQLSGRVFDLGQSVMFRVSLFDKESEIVLVSAKAVWSTPARTEQRLQSGVGFAFDLTDVAQSLKHRVDKMLEGSNVSSSMTV